MARPSVILVPLLLAACTAPAAQPPSRSGPWDQTVLGWRLDDGGSTLRILDPDGTVNLAVTCSLGERLLIATVPSFTPVGSEDRFNLGFGPYIVTLVADPTRQEAGTGVTARGPIPANIRELLSQGNKVAANYGYQTLDPQVPPPGELADAFAAACEQARR